MTDEIEMGEWGVGERIYVSVCVCVSEFCCGGGREKPRGTEVNGWVKE